MNRWTALAALVCLLFAAWLWYDPQPGGADSGISGASASAGETGSEARNAQDAEPSNSPFSVKDATDEEPSISSTSVERFPANDTAQSPASSSSTGIASDAMTVDVSAIARGPVSDDEFIKIVQALKNDPQLLLQLIDEFRQENDPDRRALLARLLGDVGGPDVLLTASELIYSGDPDSRKLGLDLLQEVQPGNSEARDIATGLLATEVDSEVLIDTLTTLASPGEVDELSRDFLTEQVAILTGHEDASVRGVSFNILSRWSNDERYTPVLIGGLKDRESTVRESAAYALVGHEDRSQTVIDSLLAVAVNTDERERTRRGSILALRSMPISDELRQQVNAIEYEMNKRPR